MFMIMKDATCCPVIGSGSRYMEFANERRVRMTLRDECIDMIKLIMDTREKDPEYLLNYEMETNTVEFLCLKTYKPTIEYYNDSRCAGCEGCIGNNHGEMVSVDLIITIFDLLGSENEGTYYLNFCKKPEKKEYADTIRYINSRKQLMEFIIEIKKKVEENQIAYAKYAKKIIELKGYCADFLKQVQTDFPIFKNIKAEILPIVFDSFYRKNQGGNIEYDVGGDLVIDEVQITIRIYGCWGEIEELKKTIRHEILHYVLFREVGTYKDDDPVFHYLCNKYDAHAYKELSEMDLFHLKLLEYEGDDAVAKVMEEARKIWHPRITCENVRKEQKTA